MNASRRKAKRAISELVALLIVVTILVGTAIAVALMTGTFVQRVRPSGGGLVITGATAQKAGGGRIAITLSLQNVGSEAIRITGISVYYGGNPLAPNPSPTLPTIQPNQIATIGFSVSGNVPDYDSIYVVVNYQTVSTNSAGSVSTSIVVVP